MTGHMNFKLWGITFRLIELKAFSSSISKILSVLSSLKTSCIACIAASDLATCPPHSCSSPAAWRISFFNKIITAFPAILLSTSLTPISLNPNRLSIGISLHAIYIVLRSKWKQKTLQHDPEQNAVSIKTGSFPNEVKNDLVYWKHSI